MVKIGSKAAEFIPVLGPTLDFTKKAKKVTEITDPIGASSRGVGIIFNYCFGKAGAVSIECTLWFGLSITGGLTDNPALNTDFNEILALKWAYFLRKKKDKIM